MKAIMILYLLCISAFSEFPVSIQCQFIKEASVSLKVMEKGKTIDKPYFESKCGNTDMTFTIGDLDKKNPMLIGNLGTSQLVRLQITPDSSTIYLAEITPTGNMNIITVFLNTNTILFSKQYEMVVAPYGLILIGVFKTLK